MDEQKNVNENKGKLGWLRAKILGIQNSVKRNPDWRLVTLLIVLIVIFLFINHKEYESIGLLVLLLLLSLAKLWIDYQKTVALKKKAEAQAKAVDATEAGNRQQHYRDAVENFGHESASVRQAGARDLFQIALEETENKRQRASIAEILCSHIREVTRKGRYQEKNQDQPSNEIQSLLKMLFTMSEYGGWEEFVRFWEGIQPDLSGGYFRGLELADGRFHQAKLLRAQFQGAKLSGAEFYEADLREAQFQEVDLGKAQFHKTDLRKAQFHKANLSNTQFIESHLQGAIFQEARLWFAQFGRAVIFDCPDFRGVDLWDANFSGTNLMYADFREAILHGASFMGADLYRAEFKWADLKGAKFQGAALQNADFKGAVLNKAQFQGAKLQEAQFQAANLWGTEFQGAEFSETQFQGVGSEKLIPEQSFAGRIQARQDKDSCYAHAVFSGGLDEERINDFIANLKEAGWDTKEIRTFREKLAPHVGSAANHELPDGVVSGTYGGSDADKWITEYEGNYEAGTLGTLWQKSINQFRNGQV